VQAEDVVGNVNPRQFSRDDVHRIGIFDIRVANMDRNDGNLLLVPNEAYFDNDKQRDGPKSISSLIQPSRWRLVPIDHGLILPDQLEIATIDLVWFDWPQAKLPFGMPALRYIKSLNPDKDAARLRKKLYIRKECLSSMRVTTRLLKIGALEYRLTLHQIAEVLCRKPETLDTPSDLERIVKQSLYSAYATSQQRNEMVSSKLGVQLDLQVVRSRQHLLSHDEDEWNANMAIRGDSGGSDSGGHDPKTARFGGLSDGAARGRGRGQGRGHLDHNNGSPRLEPFSGELSDSGHSSVDQSLSPVSALSNSRRAGGKAAKKRPGAADNDDDTVSTRGPSTPAASLGPLQSRFFCTGLSDDEGDNEGDAVKGTTQSDSSDTDDDNGHEARGGMWRSKDNIEGFLRDAGGTARRIKTGTANIRGTERRRITRMADSAQDAGGLWSIRDADGSEKLTKRVWTHDFEAAFYHSFESNLRAFLAARSKSQTSLVVV